MPGHLLTVPLALNLPAAVWAWGVVRGLLRPERTSSSTPRVSVIVVGRNEAEQIDACLNSLLGCDYPADALEIVFVDDHSNDGTLELARGVALTASDRLVVHSAPDDPADWGPKKRALAYGVARSSGEFLLLTDADCVVPKLWIRSLVERFGERTGVVIGPAMPPRRRGLLNRMHYLERLTVNVTMAAATGFGSVASACGNSIAYRRRAWEGLPGFPHPTLPSGDDDLMAQAVRTAGWEVGLAASSAALVQDLRSPTMQRELQAAVRHQSTARLYPMRWRALYLLTIIANVLILATAVLACFHAEAAIMLVVTLLMKLPLDVLPARSYAKRIGAPVGLAEIAIGSLLLPLYVSFKPMLLALPHFEWRGRQHQAGRRTR
jgi:cellulose synthase/poly-beta-1,6-N-acetylglucosamine synthase-like glycosyltransferase